MAWPFTQDKPQTPPNPDAAASDPPKPGEKTPQELIAESIAAALNPFNDTLKAVNDRIGKLEENTRKPAPKAEAGPGPVSVLEDEDAAFATRLGPVVLRQLELEARIVRGQIEGEYKDAGFGEIWNQYRKEIESTLSNSQLYTPDGSGGVKALRGDPDYVRNVVDMIFGRAARQAGMRFDGKNKTFFLESAGGGDGAAPKPSDDGLTPDQRKVFQRMGVSTEDAKKSIAKLRFVS